MQWRILCYHTVDKHLAKAFAQQLDSFARTGWRFCTVSEGLALSQDKTSNDKTRYLTVSFDDGDHTVCEVAQPLLEERGIRAMLYLTTDFVSQGTVYWANPERRAVTWEQLGHWLASGNEIGSHTHTHCNLSTCSLAKAEEELVKSQAIVRQELGMTPVHFSYPWGQHNQETLILFKRSSTWLSAATIDRGWNRSADSPFLLKRDLIDPDWLMNKVHFRMILGNFKKIYQLQRVLRGLPYSQ